MSIYSHIYKHVLSLINKYDYTQFNGPLTKQNFPTLKELQGQSNTAKKYDLLTKQDMETRLEFFEIMNYRATNYIIDSNKREHLFILFHWEDCKVSNLYLSLKQKDKHKFSRILFREGIYFERLSNNLLLVGFDVDKDYAYNQEIELIE